MIKKTFQSIKSKAMIELNYPIRKPNFDKAEITILNKGKKIDREAFTSSFKMLEDSKGFTVDFDFKELELFKARITISNLAESQVRRNLGESPVNGSSSQPDESEKSHTIQEKEVVIEDVTFYSPNEDWANITDSEATKGAFKTVQLVTFVASASLGMLIIKLFQIFDLLLFVSVAVPLNFQQFLMLFQENLFDILPNLIQFNEEGVCDLHPKLIETEQDCMILNSAGSIFIQLLLALVAKGVVVGLIIGLGY